jgi:hypothetical protein
MENEKCRYPHMMDWYDINHKDGNIISTKIYDQNMPQEYFEHELSQQKQELCNRLMELLEKNKRQYICVAFSEVRRHLCYSVVYDSNSIEIEMMFSIKDIY